MIKDFKKFKEEKNLGLFVKNIIDKSNDEQKEFILRIIGEYLKDIDPMVNLYNSLNILDDNQKDEIKRRIQLYLDDHQGDVDITASINSNEIIEESYGKNVLNTFFKCLTALGLKENTMSSEHQHDFLFLYWFGDLDISKVKSVFERFKSLSLIEIDWSYPSLSLYFGLNINGNFQYGWSYGDDLSIIGEFKLTKSNLNFLKTMEYKSSLNLRQFLSTITMNDIELALKSRQVLIDFPINHQEKKGVIFKDKILTIAYLGVNGELEDIKNKLKEYLQKFKWSENILVSVKAKDLWLYLQIKIK